MGYPVHYSAMGNRVPDWESAEPCPQHLPWLPEARDTPILDLGCGFGGWLSRLAATGYTDLTGVDADAGMARVAAEGAGSRARIECADGMEWLRGHPGAYGLIMLYDVLEHVAPEDVVSLLTAGNRALRPGGALVVRTPNMQALGAGYGRYIDLTHRTGFTEPSLRQAFNLAGFPEPQFLPDPVEPWWEGWRPWAPWRGLRLRSTLNRMLHQAVFGLRDQRPRPTRFAIDLQAWATREGGRP